MIASLGVEFRLLGLLEVVAENEPVRIVRGRESALLALLLLHPNQPLATDQIVEELWGAAAPVNAAKSVHIYVSRLRKALGGDRIETTSVGYRIRLEAGELDSERFAQLAAEGRRQEALALWRGEPLADFRFDAFAQAEIRRLEALRDEVWIDECEAEITGGRVAQAIPELEALIGRRPLWERPREQLMRALYLVGRQADALELYRSTRVLLRDELGVEPGSELQRLEREILNHDPALGTPSRPQQPLHRKHGVRLAAVGGMLLLIATAAVGALVLTRPGSTRTLPYIPNSLVRLDTGTKRVDAALPMAGPPAAVAVSNRRLWITSLSRTVSVVSRSGLRPQSPVTLSFTPETLLPSGGRIWAAGGNSIVAINPVYGAVSPPIVLRAAPGQGPSIRAAPALGGGIWVADGRNVLRRYSAAGRPTGAVNLHAPLTDVTAGLRRLWVLSSEKATLFELDRSTGAMIVSIKLVSRPGYAAPDPVAVTVGAGSVWVLEGSPPSVIRVDPRGDVVTTIPLGIGSDPVGIAAADSGVWVADSGDGTIGWIDPTTNALKRIVVGGSPTGIAVSDTHVWATIQAGLDANTGGIPAPLVSSERAGILPASVCSPVYGEGRPDVLLAADLPLQGYGSNALTIQMSNAIRFVLARHHFRAGRLNVGYQLCDDSSAETGSWTRPTCRANAEAIARQARVVGIIGPFNSGCAKAELPILARAHTGAVPVISPSATYLGLTHHGPGTQLNEPGLYRAHGAPIFMRVVAADDAQGAANAVLAKRLGLHSLYLLADGSSYGRGLTAAVATTAKRLGIHIVGAAQWEQHGDLGKLARKVAAGRPDGVFLAGTVDEGGDQMIVALRNALGRRPRILLSDGFTPFPALLEAGAAAEGVTVTVAVPALSRLPRAGKVFVATFGRAIGGTPEPYSVAAGAAAETMLAAIARSNGTRASVRQELLRGAQDGIIGRFRFDQNGDTTRPTVSVYQVTNGQAVLKTTIIPPRSRDGGETGPPTGSRR